MKRLYNWFLETRLGLCLGSLLVSVVISLFVGLCFFAVSPDTSVFELSLACFIWFGAFIAIGGLLIILTNMKPEYCWGYGAALYYGTIFVASLCSKWWKIGEAYKYTIGFIFAFLLCYISWLKYFKEKHDAED